MSAFLSSFTRVSDGAHALRLAPAPRPRPCQRVRAFSQVGATWVKTRCAATAVDGYVNRCEWGNATGHEPHDQHPNHRAGPASAGDRRSRHAHVDVPGRRARTRIEDRERGARFRGDVIGRPETNLRT